MRVLFGTGSECLWDRPQGLGSGDTPASSLSEEELDWELLAGWCIFVGMGYDDTFRVGGIATSVWLLGLGLLGSLPTGLGLLVVGRSPCE